MPVDKDTTQEEEIHVMWTHTRNTDLINGWMPNHCVACIPELPSSMQESHEPQPKRAKHDSGDSCEGDYIKCSQSETPTLDTTPEKYFETSQQEKAFIGDKWQTPEIGDAPNQPRKHAFPKCSFGAKRRAFNVSWFDRWKWLHYLECSDSVFCYVCITAYKKGSFTCHRKENAFISKGFRNWKKATDRFVQHANSDCHRETFEREFKLKSEVKDIGESLS